MGGHATEKAPPTESAFAQTARPLRLPLKGGVKSPPSPVGSIRRITKSGLFQQPRQRQAATCPYKGVFRIGRVRRRNGGGESGGRDGGAQRKNPPEALPGERGFSPWDQAAGAVRSIRVFRAAMFALCYASRTLSRAMSCWFSSSISRRIVLIHL